MSDSFAQQMFLNPQHGQDQKSVPPLASMTQPLPIKNMERTFYWICSAPNHKMNRTDGKVLHFRHGILATNDYHDCVYLQNEVVSGNPFVREATEAETRNYKMTIDPTGTVRAEMRPEMESEIRNELEHQIRASMLLKLNDLSLTEEQTKKLEKLLEDGVSEEFGGTAAPVIEEAANIQGTENVRAAAMRAKIAAKQPGATVFVPQTIGKLTGIVGTDKIVNSAESNSGVK